MLWGKNRAVTYRRCLDHVIDNRSHTSNILLVHPKEAYDVNGAWPVFVTLNGNVSCLCGICGHTVSGSSKNGTRSSKVRKLWKWLSAWRNPRTSWWGTSCIPRTQRMWNSTSTMPRRSWNSPIAPRPLMRGISGFAAHPTSVTSIIHDSDGNGTWWLRFYIFLMRPSGTACGLSGSANSFQNQWPMTFNSVVVHGFNSSRESSSSSSSSSRSVSGSGSRCRCPKRMSYTNLGAVDTWLVLLCFLVSLTVGCTSKSK